jgi:hypothetical protein
MFRFLFRFAGLVVIALSFLFVVYDGTKSIADQTTYISPVHSWSCLGARRSRRLHWPATIFRTALAP